MPQNLREKNAEKNARKCQKFYFKNWANILTKRMAITFLKKNKRKKINK